MPPLFAETLRIGSPAPGFVLPSAEGKTVRLSDFKGDVVLIVFWAPWCVSCREELTLIEMLRKKYEGKGFSVVAICVDTPSSMANKFLNEFPATFPVLMDRHSAVADSFGVTGLPASFLLDGEGIVRNLYKGYSKEVSAIQDSDVGKLFKVYQQNKRR